MISDNHNSLKAGPRGPTLLEDFVLREKITSFDHERIPERAVHARGAGAFGYFECTEDISKYTSAGFLTEVGKRTPVLTRFSTVAGSRGSMDTARDVRGFAIKFYTDEGNYDFVGNNIPVFFIQDAIKFPDLIHAAKPEQATFVKFHWKPTLGVHSLPWEESQQLGGLDPDYHRKDLAEAIKNGQFPEWELGVQLIPEADEFKFPFDLLDPTKLVPEELVPVRKIGRLVLNRNPDNYFAEIEQAAFHPGHLVPGIDFSNDPLLQGRLFSYTDTQLTRLGGPNFHELPVNRPLSNVHNNNRDGFGRQLIPRGNVAYEPNSLKKGGCPFHAGAGATDPQAFVSYNERISAQKVRARSSSFGDHISQAKLFFDSQNEVEQTHIKNAFSFELSKVKNTGVRDRMCNLLMFVNMDLAKEVASNVGAKLPAKPTMPPSPGQPDNNIVPDNHSLEAAREDDATFKPKVQLPKKSKALGIADNNPRLVASRKVALIITPKTDKASLNSAKAALKKEGIGFDSIVPKLSLQKNNEDGAAEIEQCLSTTPSHSYDGVILFTEQKDYDNPKDVGAALRFVGQAFKHCKTIATVGNASKLLNTATMGMSEEHDEGVTASAKALSAKDMTAFIESLAEHRHWSREEPASALPY
ncbi:MAG: catalase [Proteobacteria bacterium]|nr:MAG: catalase [Pseudomonadota bacterium]